MGMRVISEDEKDKFLDECYVASKDVSNVEKNLEEVYDRFERDIILLGSTAVEDRL